MKYLLFLILLSIFGCRGSQSEICRCTKLEVNMMHDGTGLEKDKVGDIIKEYEAEIKYCEDLRKREKHRVNKLSSEEQEIDELRVSEELDNCEAYQEFTRLMDSIAETNFDQHSGELIGESFEISTE